jgi:hypothetical protein
MTDKLWFYILIIILGIVAISLSLVTKFEEDTLEEHMHKCLKTCIISRQKAESFCDHMCKVDFYNVYK